MNWITLKVTDTNDTNMKKLLVALAIVAMMCSCTTTGSSTDTTRSVGEPERTVSVMFNGNKIVYEDAVYCYAKEYLHIVLADGTDLYYSPACEWEFIDKR